MVLGARYRRKEPAPGQHVDGATGPYRPGMGRRLSTIQGIYYLVTGLWPLVSLRTFEAVTGPKTDRWLVRMVGLLAAAIGASLLRGGAQGGSHRTLPVASALAFAGVDVIYVLRGTIRPIYLGDAAVQFSLVAGWWAVGRRLRAR
jgi:hypothetical protein